MSKIFTTGNRDGSGTLQHVFDYLNDQGETVSIDVQSNVGVPEPASFALLGGTLLGFAALRRRRA